MKERIWESFRLDRFSQYNVILMYHSVGGGLHDDISPGRFRADLKYLSKKYEIVDLPNAVTSSTSEKKVALTFDDGCQDFYENVVPILHEFDVPATVFVIAATLFEEEFEHDDVYEYEYMTPSQLRELVADNLVTIGNHTYSHPDMSTLSDPEQIEAETVGAKRDLERELSTKITRFAYPYNRHNAEVVDAVSVSHEYAVAGAEWGRLLLRDSNPCKLPRINGAADRNELESAITDRRTVLRHYKNRGQRFARRIRGAEM